MVNIRVKDNPFFGIGKRKAYSTPLRIYKKNLKANFEIFCKFCKKKTRPRKDEFVRTSDFKIVFYTCEHCKRILISSTLPYKIKKLDPKSGKLIMVEV